MDTSPSWLQGVCSNTPRKSARRSWEIRPCFIAKASTQSPGTRSPGDKVEEPLLVSSHWDVIRCSTLKQEKQTDNKIGGRGHGKRCDNPSTHLWRKYQGKQYWFFYKPVHRFVRQKHRDVNPQSHCRQQPQNHGQRDPAKGRSWGSTGHVFHARLRRGCQLY